MKTLSSAGAFCSHIAAASSNNVLGLKGKLPWHIPEDLRFFRKTTMNKAVIMGRKTFESLNKKPLPGRLNVVLTRDENFKAPVVADELSYFPLSNIQAAPSFSIEEALVNSSLSLVTAPSLKEALSFCSQKEIARRFGKEIFITGGGEIYKQSLSMVQKIYLTRIHKRFQGDAFYPEIPQSDFKETRRKDRLQHNPPFSFLIYERIQKTREF